MAFHCFSLICSHYWIHSLSFIQYCFHIFFQWKLQKATPVFNFHLQLSAYYSWAEDSVKYSAKYWKKDVYMYVGNVLKNVIHAQLSCQNFMTSFFIRLYKGYILILNFLPVCRNLGHSLVSHFCIPLFNRR